MKTLSKDIKNVFDELIKLLIKKNLKTPVNPSITKASTSDGICIYKPKSNRNGDDVISRYIFTMTNESLGWTGCVMMDFELILKSISGPSTSDGKYSSIYAGPKKRLAFTDSEFVNSINRQDNLPAKRSEVIPNDRLNACDTQPRQSSDSFSDRDFDKEFEQPIDGSRRKCKSRYSKPKFERKFASASDLKPSKPARFDRQPAISKLNMGTKFQGEKSIQDVLSSKKFQNSYISDLKYPFVFKMLEDIGKNIIDQTAPHVTLEETLKMSTAQLRLKLNALDQNLNDMREFEPEIFDDYVDMVLLINSVNKHELKPLINLVASLTYQKWDEMAPEQKTYFEKNLGSEFLQRFHANNLITILLQSDNCNLILNCALLYPLMKMLFVVFGYSKLIPNIIFDKSEAEDRAENKARLADDLLRDHDDGDDVSCYRRSDCDSANEHRRNASENGSEHRRNASENGRPCGCDPKDDRSNSSADFDETYNGLRWDQMPNIVEPCVYQNIKIFGNLYPVIISLMGGTKEFPPEDMLLHCTDIAENYNMMDTISEYLWRFNDYSYKEYMESMPEYQPNLINKINNKIRSLSSKGSIGSHLY
jgi:hypothetical protein